MVGPLISVSDNNSTVTGVSRRIINGNGSFWWDGYRSNKGKTRPYFFFAHKLTGGLPFPI